MVLTPRFHLSQNENCVLVHIHIPNVRVSGMEITVLGGESNEFSFYCRPYLLRLTLPGEIHDEDDEDETKRPRAVYDPKQDNGMLTIYLTKRNEHEEFINLDMITSLIKAGSAKPRVGTGRHGLGIDGQGSYGFMNGFQNFFGEDGFLEEFPDLIDLPHPDNATPEMRTTLREIHEDAMFSGERYRADLFYAKEDDIYKQAMSYEYEWSLKRKQSVKVEAKQEETTTKASIFGNGNLEDALQSLHLNVSSSLSISNLNNNNVFQFGQQSVVDKGRTKDFQFGQQQQQKEDVQVADNEKKESNKKERSHNAFFTEEERRQLTLLTMRDFSENDALKRAHLKLIDVLLAFCYENRMGCGELNVESHWTIRKLSATLSWLEDFTSLEQVCKSFARRCLVFPYLRRWDVCCKAAMDCAMILDDSRWMLRAMLKVRQLLSQSQSAYLLNKLFVDDMCVFLQLKNQSWLDEIPNIKQVLLATFDIHRKVPTKDLVGWNLAKVSSYRKIDAETLKTGHLLGLTPKKAPVFAQDRNVIDELD